VPPKCPRLTFRVTVEGDDDDYSAESDYAYSITARDPLRNWVGQIEVDLMYSDGELIQASVGLINVDRDLQRCGVGTRLYERAARIACKRGVKLRSDTSRSNKAEAFWRKQERKGRVVCEKSYYGSGCEYYEIKKCPVKSLRGAR
jgi:GNAT superfamily N-acetyltransferase